MLAVSAALASRMTNLGLNAGKIRVRPNGVDLDMFRPLDRSEARAQLDCTGFTLLSVGNLIELKGHHLIILALAELPDVTLLVAGDGPEASALRQLAESLGVEARVRFLGLVPQVELPGYYSASDCLVLASSNEGTPNVLLEAMACGTPVVATAVGGIPEIVTCPECGVLVRSRSASGIVEGIRTLRAAYPDRDNTRAYAERFDWKGTVTFVAKRLQEAADEGAARE